MDQDKKKITFDPPVRTMEEGGHSHLAIELPGVTEEQIRIDLEKTTLTLTISDEGRIRKKTLRIPRGARLMRKKFSEGVLEILLDNAPV